MNQNKKIKKIKIIKKIQKIKKISRMCLSRLQTRTPLGWHTSRPMLNMKQLGSFCIRIFLSTSLGMLTNGNGGPENKDLP